MAVLTEVPGLEVGIFVNETASYEYSQSGGDRDEDSPASVTKYIEGKDGASFQIRINLLDAFKYLDYDILAHAKVDGQTVQQPLWSKVDKPHFETWIEGIETKTGDGWTRRNLVFANLTTDDTCGEKVNTSMIDRFKSLGQITVDFWRVKIAAEVADYMGDIWTEDQAEIPEKALKGKSISQKARVASGEVKIYQPLVFNTTNIDPHEEPFAKFCFRYRSLSDLKAEFIIPRTRSPTPLEERPLESLNLEESIELLKRQREHAARTREELSRVKRERGRSAILSGEGDDDIIVVQQQKRRRIATETIDLTGD